MGLLSALATPKFVLALGGWRASGFALCALLALSWGGWQRAKVARLETDLLLQQAVNVGLHAERNAANAIAADYEARAEAARVAMVEAQEAAKKAAAARARKWDRVKSDVPAWSDTPVPREVVEVLR